jgi:CDP-diacylglycerol--glycerol-3-phosphate 3-phosphatidyltransferase
VIQQKHLGGEKNIRQLPNEITVFRILLSFTLLFLLRQPMAFVVVYALCGVSDVVDGLIARRFNFETALGAKLDSLADFIFFTISIFAFFTFIHIENPALLLGIAAFVSIIRVINFIFTRKQFRQWAVMHTVGNKATGGLLFFSIPICVWLKSVPLWLLLIVGIVGALSATEEIVILLTTKQYAINRKSVFIKPPNERKAIDK